MNSQLRTWSVRCWNVGVVAVLLTLAYWGHETKWQIPSFNAIVSGDVEGKKDKPKSDKPPASPDPAVLPPIVFASASSVRQVGIEIQKAEQRDLDLIVSANATVAYDQTKMAQLSSRVSGFVARVGAYQGQFVKKGHVLAIVDSPEVGQARTEMLQEHSTHYFAARRLERVQSLVEKGAAPEAALREAELTAREARARRWSAHQKLLNLGLEFDLASLDKETPDDLARRIQVIGLAGPVMQQLPGAPKSANFIPLLAPCEGIVTQYDLVVGKRITPERSDIEITDVRTMWIRLSVRKEDAGQLALGQRVRYTSAASPSVSLEGRLVFISSSVDEKTRTVQARAAVDNPLQSGSTSNGSEGPWLLRANEYGNTQVTVGRITQAVLVRAKAVQRFDDIPLVFVLRADGKSFEPRKVELGELRNDWIQVISGVQPGESVATVNSFVLKSELLKDRLEAP